MTLRATYAPSQKVLHWAVAVLVFALVPMALAMANWPDGAVKNALYEWHKSVGLTVLALALARLLVRAARGAPPLVAGLPAWQHQAARASHLALYALIMLVPLLGWAGTSACCAPVMLYFTLPLTLPVSGGMPVGEAILKVHQVAAFTLVALALLHAGPALHHHLVRRDGTLRRMGWGKAG